MNINIAGYKIFLYCRIFNKKVPVKYLGLHILHQGLL